MFGSSRREAVKIFENVQRYPHRILSFRDFERLLAAFGFVVQRTRGSHRAYKHPSVPELLTIQSHGNDARPYQVRKFLDMMRQFQLELDE